MKKVLALSIFFGFIFFLSPIQAATISIDGAGHLIYQADLGEENALTVYMGDNNWVFNELALNITEVSDVCFGDGTTEVYCDEESINSVEIQLSDLGDRIWMKGNDKEVFLYGGSGADEIYWAFDKFDSNEDAEIDGGAGTDLLVITGDSSDDNILIDESGQSVRIKRLSPSPAIRIDVDTVENFEIYGDRGDDIITLGVDFADIDDVRYMTFKLSGEDGNDTIDTSIVEDDLFGSDYAISIYGGDGVDVLEGTQGKDFVDCGNGIDTYKDNGGADDIDDSCDDLTASQQFSDILAHTFQYYISDLYTHGIVDGYSDGFFHPDNYVTRGQMSKFIVNAFDISPDVSCEPFSDVVPSHAFYEYTMTLKCNDLVSGYYDGTYKPDETVTRGQVTKFVSKAMEYQKIIITETPATFPDVPESNVFSGYIGFLTGLNTSSEQIVSGYSDGTYRPNEGLTRGQMSKIVSNSRNYWLGV